MLNTFSDFLNEPHRYKNICDNSEMEHIFTKILSNERNIIKMVSAIDHNITPVSICAKDIEAYIDSVQNTSITLDRNIDTVKADNYRQAVGAMIAYILKPFGFEKIKGGNRPIPAEYKGKYLFSGARYSKTGSATLKIEQKIVPIESNS
jgi:hypothetical protein